MTLSRKGSRALIVDGISYRWLIRRKETYNDIQIGLQTPGGVPLRVAIEKENAKGTLLVVTSDQPRLTKYGMKAGVVRPSDVERWIREALAAEWNPGKPGPVLYRRGETAPNPP
jgi:hypothetical protein